MTQTTKKCLTRDELKSAIVSELGRENSITRDKLMYMLPEETPTDILAILEKLNDERVISIDLALRERVLDNKPTVNSIDIEYLRDSEVCMGELLAQKKADGLTIEEAFNLYIACMKRAEGDRFFRVIGTSDAAMCLESPEGYEEL